MEEKELKRYKGLEEVKVPYALKRNVGNYSNVYKRYNIDCLSGRYNPNYFKRLLNWIKRVEITW